MLNLAQKIRAALGEDPVDILLKNAMLVNVLSGEIHEADIAIKDDIVIGLGDYQAKQTLDLKGKFVCPGLIDGHLHLESSMLSIPEFAANVVPQGTIAVVADPHEIANVMGAEGIKHILRTSENCPLKVYIMFPSCVPATPFETSGATLGPKDMLEFRDEPRILGLAEMMNYPGVLFQDQEVLDKIEAFEGKPRDGHAPGLSGKQLCAYIAAGIGSDHECSTLEEAREKLRLGMKIMIREGSAARNLDSLLPLVNSENSRNCFFVTDDLEPDDILSRGHIIALLRKAVAKGVNPIRAVQMASVNTAQYFGLRNMGAVASGYKADLMVVDDLKDFTVRQVFSSGELVAENGKMVVSSSSVGSVEPIRSFNVNWEKTQDISVSGNGAKINVIGVIPGQIITTNLVEAPKTVDGVITSDTERDILKIVVIERHNGTGSNGVAFIKGFGLKRGAIGGSVAHDSHNIIVIGVTDEDIILAAHEIDKMGGGMVAVDNGKLTAKLPLPIAGLMSDKPISEVQANLQKLNAAAKELGCPLDSPFSTMSFMALTPIPELKLTDLGLFDSLNFKFTSLFAAM